MGLAPDSLWGRHEAAETVEDGLKIDAATLVPLSPLSPLFTLVTVRIIAIIAIILNIPLATTL